jgi:hypothetical protein
LEPFAGHFSSQLVSEAVIKLSMIYILRSITMVTTILPRAKSCEVKQLDFFHYTIGGTCYDKMFSGHFAFGLLCTSLIFKYGIADLSLTNFLFWGLMNTIHFFLLTMTRGHFTQDVVVAGYVVALVHFAYDYWSSQ